MRAWVGLVGAEVGKLNPPAEIRRAKGYDLGDVTQIPGGAG